LIGAGVTIIDTRLILVLGAATALWSAWRIQPWIDKAQPGVAIPAREAQL
jgi:MFS transporter, DHA1 family, tetracycline resistance protein